MTRPTCATCALYAKRQHPGPGFLFPMCANPQSENHGCAMNADDTCDHHTPTAREGEANDGK